MAEELALPSSSPGSEGSSAAPSKAGVAALPQAMTPMPSALGHFAGAGFGPHRDNLGKDEVVRTSRACPASLGPAGIVWIFDRGPLLTLSAFYQEHLFEDRVVEAMMECHAWVQVVLSWEHKDAGTFWMAVQLVSTQKSFLRIYL